MPEDKEIELLLFLFSKGSMDGRTALPLSDCPVEGVDLKELKKYKRVSINGKKIHLMPMGKISAMGEIALRKRREGFPLS